MQTYRYGMAWRAIGVTLVVCALVFPLLMMASNERIDAATVVVLVAMGLAGVWCYAYFARYRVTLGDDGMIVERLFRPRMHVAWREVVAARATDNAITFATADQRKLSISTYFSAYEAVADAAARNLPEAAFPSAEERPVAGPEIVTAEERRELHCARKAAWLRTARQSFYAALVLAVMAFAAGAAFERVPFRDLPRALAIVSRFVLSFAESWGALMAVLLGVFALLCAIMAAQEARNAR